MRPGGLENYIMNLYTHIDRERVQFDFAVHTRDPKDYGDRIAELGGSIHLLPRLTRDPAGNLRMIRRLVQTENYDIVDRHTPNAMITPQLMAAKKAGAITICHAHSETDPAKAAHYAGRMLMPLAADVRIACSDRAGRWMFGRRDYKVVKNAINIARFRYDPESEHRLRTELGLMGADIFGHIGNFAECKNHLFLLDVFREICRLDDRAVLLCLGDGEMRPQIEKRIAEYGLESRVILAGMRRDADACMSAMDVMIFPSIYEGIPITLIEAQAAGLPVLMSDTITDEVIITGGLIHKKSIGLSPCEWARDAVALMSADALHGNKAHGLQEAVSGSHTIVKPEHIKTRIQQTGSIVSHGYDIEHLAAQVPDYLEKLISGKKTP